MYTSDLRGAGTDANVTLEMHGKAGSVGETRLDTAANNFERGAKDVFRVSASDIGELERLVVAHDGSGEALQALALHIFIPPRVSFP